MGSRPEMENNEFRNIKQRKDGGMKVIRRLLLDDTVFFGYKLLK